MPDEKSNPRRGERNKGVARSSLGEDRQYIHRTEVNDAEHKAAHEARKPKE